VCQKIAPQNRFEGFSEVYVENPLDRTFIPKEMPWSEIKALSKWPLLRGNPLKKSKFLKGSVPNLQTFCDG
jgi:hypothetical protein